MRNIANIGAGLRMWLAALCALVISATVASAQSTEADLVEAVTDKLATFNGYTLTIGLPLIGLAAVGVAVFFVLKWMKKAKG